MMADNAPHQLYVPRRYQEEILASAQRGNVIAAMDTGTGKTLIAVKLAQWIHSLPYDQRKVVIYLAPTVPLVKQQADYLHSQVGTYLKTKSYIGQVVDLWNAAQWEKEFRTQDILVMTPQILVDLLSHGRWSLSKVSLIVFDEVHNATKNHPYAQIMRHYFSKLPVRDRPKVFGMTASPTFDHKKYEKSIRALEALTTATVISVKEHQAELASFSHRPIEQVFLYSTTSVDEYINFKLAPLWELVDDLPEVITKLSSRRDVLLTSLGPYAAEFFTHRYLSNFLGKNQAQLSDSVKATLSTVVSSLHDDLATFASHIAAGDMIESLVSPKLRLLADILCENHTGHFKCIIFVGQKHIASAMSALLPQLPALSWVTSAALVGHSAAGAADIGGMDAAEQGDVVAKFRSNSYNVLVATPVAEEGLDFQACHLVVRFDGLQHFKGYIQSRGRARRQNSTYIVLLDREDTPSLEKFESMRAAEPVLREKYASASLPEASDAMEVDQPSDNDATLREHYVVASTGATLTYDSAINVLERLCASAPSDEYGVIRPTYTIHELGEQRFSAVVDLPPALPLPRDALRFDSGSEPRSSKREARRAAAFSAVRTLHALPGVFDDHLLPMHHKRDKGGEDAYGRKPEDVSDIPERMKVHVIQPWVAIGSEIWVHEYRVNGILAIGFVTGARMPDVEFTVQGTHYSLGNSYSLPTDDILVNILVEYTKNLLRLCVSTKEYLGPFAFYFASLDPITLRPDLATMRSFNENPTTKDWTILTTTSDPVLILNRIRSGHLQVLERQTQLVARDRPVSVDGPNDELEFDSYCAYYEKKFWGRNYTLHLPPSSPMLLLNELPRLDTTLYDFDGCTGPKRQRQFSVRQQRMVPDALCFILRLSVMAAEAVRWVPQLTRRICDVVRAQSLSFDGIPLNAVIEATTLPGSAVGFDNQRLETLGDAFLKLGVSVYAFHAFPNKHEGQLTNVRIPSVSNRALLARARAFGLERFLNAEVGSRRNWTPCLLDTETIILRRSMQECVEALLGAAFATGGVARALQVGSRLGLCFGPVDQSWEEQYKRPDHCGTPRRTILQQLQYDIEYTFTNELLLLEAITHRTMQNCETQSYERLEFLGDALIDLVIIHYIFIMYPDATCGQLSWARQRAVCNTTLAWIAVNKLRVPECLLQNNVDLTVAIAAAKERLYGMPVEEIIRDGWKMDMPKPLGDVVEAVVAAMFIDMGCSYDLISAQIQLLFNDVLPILTPTMPRDPSTRLMIYIGKYGCSKVKFRKSASMDGGKNDSYSVLVHEVEVCQPIRSTSLQLAKYFAAEASLQILEDEESPFHMTHLCTCKFANLINSEADMLESDTDANDETEDGFTRNARQAYTDDRSPLEAVEARPESPV